MTDPLSQALAATGQVAYTADEAGGLLTLDGAVDQILGTGADSLLGKPIPRFDLDRESTGSFRVQHPDGTLVWVEERPFERGGLLIDRSEMIREEARTRAEAIARAKGRLGSSVAHEVNNPLAGVLNYAELARRLPEPDPRLTDSLEVITSEGGRIRELTSALGALSIPCEDPEAPYPLRPAEFLRGAAAPLRRDLRELSVELNETADDSLIPAQGRGPALQACVQALLQNALEALSQAPRPRRLDLGADVLEADDALWVVFSVEDHAGTPELDVDTMRRPFYSTRPGQRGLGLALVDGWVKRLEGSWELVPTATGMRAVVRVPVA